MKVFFASCYFVRAAILSVAVRVEDNAIADGRLAFPQGRELAETVNSVNDGRPCPEEDSDTRDTAVVGTSHGNASNPPPVHDTQHKQKTPAHGSQASTAGHGFESALRSAFRNQPNSDASPSAAGGNVNFARDQPHGFASAPQNKPKEAPRTSSRHQPTCESLGQNACAGKLGCFWSGKLCEVRIAWLHVMKTASSFGTALAHLANASLPNDAHIPSGMHKNDPQDMPEKKKDMEDKHMVLDFFESKYPIENWFQDVFRHPSNPGEHLPIMDDEWNAWNGFWVTILRQPEERTSSAWHHFGKGQGDMFQFQHAIRGQQANMLSMGKAGNARVTCEREGGGVLRRIPECENLPSPNVNLAIQRIHEFAFVGITEEFDMSICLFHAMFGGKCYNIEFMNMRPTHYGMSEAAQKAEEARLKNRPDPWDTPVYEAAKRRFKADVRKYNLNPTTCSKMCPGGDF